jgi:hypothetical protein
VRKFVGRTSEAARLVCSIKRSGFKLGRGKPAGKDESWAHEYATISGGGKSLFGFEVVSLIAAGLSESIVTSVALNFNGGTGGGRDFLHAGQDAQHADAALAKLLFARGVLETTADNMDVHLSTNEVLDYLCQRARGGNEKEVILVVHLDEVGLLNPAVCKEMVYSLLEYNTMKGREGWIVPILTHTAPLDWRFELTIYRLKRHYLGSLSISEMLELTGWKQSYTVTRLLSATGGHPLLLRDMCEPTDWVSPPNNEVLAYLRVGLFTHERVHEIGQVFNALKDDEIQQVLSDLFLRTTIRQTEAGWPSLYQQLWRSGALYCNLAEAGDTATVSLPLPLLVVLLRIAGVPTAYLDHSSPEFSPSKAFELIATLAATVSCGCRLTQFAGISRHKNVEDEFKTHAGDTFFLPTKDQEAFDGVGRITRTAAEFAALFDGLAGRTRASSVPDEESSAQEKEEARVYVQTKRADSPRSKQQFSEVAKVLDYALSDFTGRVIVMFVTDRRRTTRDFDFQQALQETLNQKRPGSLALYYDRHTSKDEQVGVGTSQHIHSFIPPNVLAF